MGHGAANTGTFCDTEPIMDPEIRAIRRAAIRNNHRVRHGTDLGAARP